MSISENVKLYLYKNAEKAIQFIVDRNRDYTTPEHTKDNEDIDIEFFGYAQPMKIVINGIKYYIDSLTTIKDAEFIKDSLYTDKVEYIAETSSDIDTIVGNIDDFIVNNDIDNSDSLATRRYYRVVELGEYKLKDTEIVEKLKEMK